MIVTDFNPKHGLCSLSVESADDLWTLRRLIRKGDVVVTRSSRILKREDEFSRPDKGERVKVTIALSVEDVSLDSSIERIRLRGTIVEASDDTVGRAGSHSVTISPGHGITIRKQRWSALDTKLVNSTRAAAGRFIVVAVDRREAGVGSLSGSHLSVLTVIESGVGGKMSDEQSSKPFIAKVAAFVSQVSSDEDEVVIAGPGHTKNEVINQLVQQGGKRLKPHLLEGFDMTGSDGVRALVKFPDFQELAKGSVLVEMQRVINEAVKRISSGDPKVAYTLARVKPAAAAGAVESCVVSDDVFSVGVEEEELVQTLNEVEARRGSVYLADSSLELGKQVSAFGGVVALLRYGLRAY
jgi:protein pelota